MEIGIIMCHSAPYRTLQMNEFAKIKNNNINVYYTFNKDDNRKWETNNEIGYKSIYLKGIKISSKYGYINKGLFSIMRNNDILMLGGYAETTYVLLAILCRIMNKKYGIIFDGISTNRIMSKEKFLKKLLKNIVVKNSNFVFANGIVGKEYFINKFKYDENKIFNQYLTVDNKLIDKMYINRNNYRRKIREKLNINNKEKVVLFSGRLIEIKNIEIIINAISNIKEKDKITFLITGGGELKETLLRLAEKEKVKIHITDFLEKQEELFEYYFAADVLVLPSIDEAWGLVVNEAMNVGMPIIVSHLCGCSLDLVKDGHNGYVFDPYDVNSLKNKLNKILFSDDMDRMGKVSKEIIGNWTMEKSKVMLEKILDVI